MVMVLFRGKLLARLRALVDGQLLKLPADLCSCPPGRGWTKPGIGTTSTFRGLDFVGVEAVCGISLRSRASTSARTTQRSIWLIRAERYEVRYFFEVAKTARR